LRDSRDMITDVHNDCGHRHRRKTELSAIQEGLAASGVLCPQSNWRTLPTFVGATSFRATPPPQHRPHWPSLQRQHMAGQSQRRLRCGKLPHRLGKEEGDLSSGAPEHPLVGNQDRSGTKYDPHRLLPRRLQRMSESIFVHASQRSPTYPHLAAKRRARGHPVCQKAPEHRRVCRPLLPRGQA
jgi:hypothetical protein